MAEMEQLLARREQIADEITAVIGRLGVLLRRETELRDTLRRADEAAGVRATPFATAATIEDAVCAELTRAGLSPHRADPPIRLAELVDGQNAR